MKSVYCLNPISNAGMSRFDDTYCIADSIENADAVLLRSASMHEMTLPDSLLAIGRAGAGVNNIPLDSCAKKGIVVFNTPGANANGVKELVIAGLMLASRDIAGGCHWVRENKNDPNIAKTAEKAKKALGSVATLNVDKEDETPAGSAPAPAGIVDIVNTATGESVMNDSELVAVISAAVMAAQGGKTRVRVNYPSNDKLVVRPRKKNKR